jgi:hypothetical protein
MESSESNSRTEFQINSLIGRTDGELYDIVGAYALSQEADDLLETLAVDRALDSGKLRKAGRRYIKKITPTLKDALCGPDGILHYVEEPTMKDVLQIVLPAVGFTVAGVVPTVAIAISLIIVRSGIREYCKGY